MLSKRKTSFALHLKENLFSVTAFFSLDYFDNIIMALPLYNNVCVPSSFQYYQQTQLMESLVNPQTQIFQFVIFFLQELLLIDLLKKFWSKLIPLLIYKKVFISNCTAMDSCCLLRIYFSVRSNMDFVLNNE